MGKKWILDVSSIEENRGSFCYLPYYLYSAYRNLGDDVVLLEDFRITQKDILDDIKPEDSVFISLWSYPQIDLCRLLHLRLPQAVFFGYAPLIKEEGFPVVTLSTEFLRSGMESYPNYISHFEFLLLSDCDGHLKDRAEVLPLCTSYGCPRNCSFCPVTPNLSDKKRIVSNIEVVLKNLCTYQEAIPGSGVHFTDEDFFYSTERAKAILERNFANHVKNGYGPPSLIALAGVDTFTAFLDSFKTDDEAFHFCEAVGLYLVEIGMESANPALAEYMGKPAFSKCIDLAERIKGRFTKVLWLSLTFSPGETLKTIADNGEFLRKYGLDPKEMSRRIRTNGTEGGLGQYFQPYTGTRDYNTIAMKGLMLTERPTRLIPSYIPNSLLESVIKVERPWNDSDKEWLNLYGVKEIFFQNEKTVGETIYQTQAPLYKTIISIAVAARLGVISQG